MRVSNLKEILSMYPDDLELYVRTTPSDWAQPLQMKNISLMEMAKDERTGIQERPKVVITSFIPEKK